MNKFIINHFESIMTFFTMSIILSLLGMTAKSGSLTYSLSVNLFTILSISALSFYWFSTKKLNVKRIPAGY